LSPATSREQLTTGRTSGATGRTSRRIDHLSRRADLDHGWVHARRPAGCAICADKCDGLGDNKALADDPKIFSIIAERIDVENVPP
jgi:hypothetical protein